ncbi:hypothetical protein HanRHA438_Chr09g0400461 [Helianthus annuus]|nr:hypothetical protein HanIR_Chr09g0419231 [Helianthus annuus]KAJ0888295.1 hypothetical protein HanRHA438_Chr09g0400461 [Helianthus annuus]
MIIKVALFHYYALNKHAFTNFIVNIMIDPFTNYLDVNFEYSKRFEYKKI